MMEAKDGSTAMAAIDTDKIERLARRASPGPWVGDGVPKCGYGWVDAPNAGRCTFGQPIQILKGQYSNQAADAAHIGAVGPDVVIGLLDRLRAAESMVGQSPGQVEEGRPSYAELEVMLQKVTAERDRLRIKEVERTHMKITMDQMSDRIRELDEVVTALRMG